MMAGYLNGKDADDGPGGNVTRLDDARRRLERRAKEEKRAERTRRLGTMTARDWVIGGVLIVMALGMLWHWVSPLVGTTGALR